MPENPRKKSPKAPSIPLNEAVVRVIAIYEKEQRHAAPTDVMAQALGYKSANNGSALAAIASLRGYGLLDRPEAGKLAVSADVQSYKYAPDEALKKEILKKWLRSPPVFEQLLNKYADSLPSDANIRFELIENGFKPATAESILKVFRESVEFANYYEDQDDFEANASTSAIEVEQPLPVLDPSPPFGNPMSPNSLESFDRIPVRLDAKRRAWLEIPTPLYNADKDRLKAQIDLLLTDDD